MASQILFRFLFQRPLPYTYYPERRRDEREREREDIDDMGLFDGFGEGSNRRNNGEMSDIEASLTTLSSVAGKESETFNTKKSHHHHQQQQQQRQHQQRRHVWI